MDDKKHQVEHNENQKRQQPSRVTLPGFINDSDVGLGDVVNRVTHAVGLRRCQGCEQRAAALNRWLVFSGRRTRR
jgi:hypothetical protein